MGGVATGGVFKSAQSLLSLSERALPAVEPALLFGFTLIGICLEMSESRLLEPESEQLLLEPDPATFLLFKPNLGSPPDGPGVFVLEKGAGGTAESDLTAGTPGAGAARSGVLHFTPCLLNLVKPKLESSLESSRGIKEGTELLLGSVLWS